jgi:hypothetical protein
MMVLLWKGVECSAKIAMTTLHKGRAAMCLLPIHDLPRFILLDARDVTDLLILKWEKQPASSAKCDKGDYKSIIRNAAHIHVCEVRSAGIFFHPHA